MATGMPPDQLDIQHQDRADGGAFFVEVDGKRLGEQTYRRLDGSRVVIDHTAVDPKLQGRGVAPAPESRCRLGPHHRHAHQRHLHVRQSAVRKGRLDPGRLRELTAAPPRFW